MDEEVRVVVEKAYERTLALMDELKEQVRIVADLLIEKETISHHDVAAAIGDR